MTTTTKATVTVGTKGAVVAEITARIDSLAAIKKAARKMDEETVLVGLEAHAEALLAAVRKARGKHR